MNMSESDERRAPGGLYRQYVRIDQVRRYESQHSLPDFYRVERGSRIARFRSKRFADRILWNDQKKSSIDGQENNTIRVSRRRFSKVDKSSHHLPGELLHDGSASRGRITTDSASAGKFINNLLFFKFELVIKNVLATVPRAFHTFFISVFLIYG